MKLFKAGWNWLPSRQDLGMTSTYGKDKQVEIIAYERDTGQLVFRFMTAYEKAN